MSDKEKRQFTRIPFRTEAKISTSNKVISSNKLRNISLGGAFVEVAEYLPEGEPCVLNVDLIGPASLLRIQVDGFIVRVEDAGIAVRFSRIDLDSLIHLRHLIKVHSLDPDVVDNEFAENLLEIKQPS
ncbi:MAG: PilZ domain-containing protein [Desulfomonile tiedjei]|nr:PilZ domain-containing protein [Desulfomonile tiedjei]